MKKIRIPNFFVCLCVCVSTLKHAITFEGLNGFVQNFLGHPNSSQVIFGQVTRIPAPMGSGSNPEKEGLRQIYLLGFLSYGVVLHLFGILRTRQKKRWERNFDFLPPAQNNEAGMYGRPGVRHKFWISGFFHKRDPTLNRIWVNFCLCNFSF